MIGCDFRRVVVVTDELVLDAVDQRVLGSLLEKQRTVPASYPMTLNALQTACNQTSSRDPVVDYDQPCSPRRCAASRSAAWCGWCGRTVGRAR